MHSDRELLELSARAAGIAGSWHRKGFVTYSGWSRGIFNPLTDDGDALRLAVQLEFEVSLGQFGTIIYTRHGKVEEIGEDGCDEMALCRRAIVRAAAAIGGTK